MKFSIDTSSLIKPSSLLIIFCFCFSFFLMDLFRKWHFNQNNFNWDVANYYSYLPAKFCNNGSFEFGNGTESFLMVSPINKRISRGTYGMALMYSPFFALGYKIAYNQKSPLDGFSEPFATCIHWGSIFYVMLGLIFLRRFLLNFYSEWVTALSLAISFFGTMLFYYTYGDGEMTHGYLFFLISSLLAAAHSWYEMPTYTKSILIGLVIGLIVLIRPTEVLISLVFIFWKATNLREIKEQFVMFFKYKFHVLIMIALVVGLWIPQLLYWKEMAGVYFYSSYEANGERFMWTDPQIFNILISYRKGWITYTPLIVIAFIGFFFMKGEIKKFRTILLIILVLHVYILSCWWDWFFGGCFGARGFAQHIAFLAIPIAACCDFFSKKENFKKSLQFLQVIFFIIIFSGICLNIGQSYQYTRNYIHFNSMTEKTYWHVFGKYYLDDFNNGLYWGSLKEPDYPKLKSGEDRDN